MTRSRELRWILPALALVAALALVVRVVPARDAVFGQTAPPPGADVAPTESGVRLLGIDSYFHLRHARYVAANFPSLMRHDPWTAYPNGARVREVGLYALATGGVAWALGRGHPDERLLQVVMAWAPVALGVAAYPVLFAAAAALWGPLAGLVAALLLLAYPGPFLDRSLLGFSDHHAAEALLLLLLLLTLARLLPGTRTGARTARQAARRGAAAALPLLAFHITWVGAPLWLVMMGISLLVGAAAAVARKQSRTAIAGIVTCGAVFSLGMVAVAAIAPDLIQEPSVLPRIVFTGIGLAVLLPAGILVATGLAERWGRSPAQAGRFLLIGGTVVIAFAMLQTGSGRNLWALLTEVRTDLVAEHLVVSQLGLIQAFSALGLLAAAAPAVLLLRTWRTGRWTEMAPVTLALMGIALALRKGDFEYILAPLAAFLAAGLAAEVFRMVRRRDGWVRWTPHGILLLLLAAPVVGTPLARPWRDSGSIAQLLLLEDTWLDAMRWLHSSTPDPRFVVDAQTSGDPGANEPLATRPFSYGVLSAWDLGNAIASLAERPVMWSQGPSSRTAGFLLASPGEELEELLKTVGAPLRYVVVDDRTLGPWARAKVISAGGTDDRFTAVWGTVTVRGISGTLVTFGPAFESSLAHRLYYGDGDGLGHYRLVFQTRAESLTAYLATPVEGGFDILRHRERLQTEEQREQALAWAGEPSQVADLGAAGLLYRVRVEPSVRIYERVEGALLVGAAPPGRNVHVAIMVRPGEDGGAREPFLWESTTESDQAGRWEVRVPYSTTPPLEERRVRTVSLYRVFLLPEEVPQSGQLSSQNAELLADGIEVDEQQVQEGAVVDVTGTGAG